MLALLQREIPGALVIAPELGNGVLTSVFTPMWAQVDALAETLRADKRLAGGHIHIFGHSQGALIARGFIQRLGRSHSRCDKQVSPQRVFVSYCTGKTFKQGDTP